MIRIWLVTESPIQQIDAQSQDDTLGNWNCVHGELKWPVRPPNPPTMFSHDLIGPQPRGNME
jgi:hypothetical protein